jgi:hypothetical protein
MDHSANLETDLEQATLGLVAATAGSAEFWAIAGDLSEVGRRISESIEDAFLDLTREHDEAA